MYNCGQPDTDAVAVQCYYMLTVNAHLMPLSLVRLHVFAQHINYLFNVQY
jgi:hypothetical protein